MKYHYSILLIFLFFTGEMLAQKNGGIITGAVVNEATMEPIPGASILVIGTSKGAVSDTDGNYTIADLNYGSYQIKISAVGYASIVKSDIIINSAKSLKLIVKLTQVAIELQGVTVSVDYFEKKKNETGSIANFSNEEIRRSPGGFEDIIRALSILPGVAQASAGRNDLVVRGGAPSENLYLIDGFLVPNINHFGTQGATGGPISYVNLDFVRETNFSSGGFSSLYGDKLSSVLSIDLKEGRNDRIGGKATISASEFGFNLEGPLAKKGSFLVSARRSYLDFIFNAAGFSFIPEYYDFLSKASYEFDSHNKLSFLFIGILDNVKYNNNTSDNLYKNSRILGSDEGSYLAGLSFRSLFNNGLFTLSLNRNYTRFDSSQKDTLLNPIFLNKSTEIENIIKGDLVYQVSNYLELDAGALFNIVNFDADIKLPGFITTFGDYLSINSLSAQKSFTKFGLYQQTVFNISYLWQITLGLREDYFSGINEKLYYSPRMAITYNLSSNLKLNFSMGIYHQAPSYIWLAAFDSNRDLKAAKVVQYIFGIEHRLREDLRFKIEGFLKDYSDYPASTTRQYFVLANTGAGYGGADDNFSSYGLEKLTSGGTGETHGIELSLQKKSSSIPIYGIASLTWSETKFTSLDGISRYGNYDQKWIFNISGGYIFNEKWEASFKFRFATGTPYTPFNADGTQSISNLNSARFSSLNSLDLRVDRRWNFEKVTLITYIDIQNIYNNKTNNYVKWDYRKNEPDYGSSIGILPSVGVSLEF
jgi:hypothetical protein